MTGLAALVAEGVLTEDVPLAPLTTYRFGGAARYFLDAGAEDDLLRLAQVLRDDPVPVVALGRGSNVVISEQGFAGVVVHPGPAMNWWDLDESGDVIAGAALPLPALARRSAEAGRSGLEFFIGIPGSVGGAVRMNAGCHGSDTASRLITARIVDMDAAAVTERGPEGLEMSYRHTNLGSGEIVVSARFSTVPGDRAECEQEMREISRWRKEHQPGGTLNAGSVFKNPPGDSAGRIIDDLGLKGLRVGGVAVSERHANFFVADDAATPQDVFDLVRLVVDRVRVATGTELTAEVQFLGDFEGDPA